MSKYSDQQRMLRLLLSTLILVLASSHYSHASSKDCKVKFSKDFEWTMIKLERSELSKPRKLTCSEQQEISSYSSNDLTITSGRVNRKGVICLSDTESNPCKHIIADFEAWVHNPPIALQEIFNVQRLNRMRCLKLLKDYS